MSNMLLGGIFFKFMTSFLFQNKRSVLLKEKHFSDVPTSSMTDVIHDIVFKTQLLSFNASIEAARAGQHGKGFSVVAEEVGNLAQMSGKAAAEIKTLLENSRLKVIDSVDVSKNTVVMGQRVTANALNIFSGIAEKVVAIDEKIAQIVNASKEQAQGVGQTSEALKQLDIATKSNERISVEAKGRAEDLSSAGMELKKMVANLIRIVFGKK